MNGHSDILIIGGGIGGMTAALYAARANLSVRIVEKEVCGGLVNWTHTVENVPSYKSIHGMDLIDQGRPAFNGAAGHEIRLFFGIDGCELDIGAFGRSLAEHGTHDLAVRAELFVEQDNAVVGLDPFIKSNGIQQGSFAHNRFLCGLRKTVKQGFSRRAFGKAGCRYFRKAGEGDPHGQDGIAQSPSPADHQEARSSAMNSFSCSNSSLATSGCLAETLLSWNGSSLRQYSSSRAGTSLEAAAVQVH